MKTSPSVLLVVLAVLLCQSNAAKKIKPAREYFNLCSRSDPNLAECVKKSIIEATPKLIKGIPDLNIVPIDPMNVPKIELRDGSGNFNFQQNLTNLKIHGLKEFDLRSVKIDTDKWTLEMDLWTPFMRFEGEYEMTGKILVLPINGKGHCEYNFTQVHTVSHSNGTLVERNGKKYMEITDMKWDINVGGAQFIFTNLYNGDKTLGDATNLFLNENWKDAFETYKSLPEEAFGELTKELSNNVFKLFPVDELFLP